VPVRVDEGGLRVDELPDVPVVVVSPEHQFPTGRRSRRSGGAPCWTGRRPATES
jgi:hypothetical protein